ncbi:Asp-tRNA(Asn)/Glu-tRNA(Gln) amidotransferase subunit GatB [Chitinispirillales bacterium ANBcel5]|uniref:Asp-tRNA(Asn)/Glu-tRNA(Gln) amidotransferase subunit GatB n=1 Tax=Cellulosispirillum alkaliphilum TaxID=3039283 RepID=UPI002A512095|nr:Asp-tRNA(Asn)/Glu-tRNA(Gln) amidotransferase subunit GatB [Chitinispirillales bacterium ANBcel5]
MNYEIVVGLEVHAQLLTKTKLFCGCTTPFGDPPNTHGCPVCLGLPGALPVLNRRAAEMAVRIGLALNCGINEKSVFARKNYFYPDLPKGYQISQYEIPVCGPGTLPITVDGEEKMIGITRVHLEEDAGKLIHDQDIDSLFDVNRCGTPLIEIVSEPDMRSPAEAYAYLTSLKQILEYLQICDCNMEQGSLRCDANISIRPQGESKLGTKTEIKNMNSFRNLEKALEYEAARQKEVLSSGGTVLQQTFLWDPVKNRSVPMRTKEDAHDYRYFPDPDLMPLIIETPWVEQLKTRLPELPATKRHRFMESYGLNATNADILTSSAGLAQYYEETVAASSEPKASANWIMGDIMRIINEKKVGGPFSLNVSAQRLGDLIKLIEKGSISAKAAKKVLQLMESEDKDAATVVKEQGLEQVSDTGALQSEVQKVLDANPGEVQRYKDGEKKLTSFFMGQVMKATRGKANPKEVSTILRNLLG